MMLVSDNESNMLKMARSVKVSDPQRVLECESDSEDEGTGSDQELDESESVSDETVVEEEVRLPRFLCIAHTLQLVLKEVDKQQAYCNVVTKVEA